MKKVLVFLCTIFICRPVPAHTIEWYVDDTLYQTTTCDSGDNVTPPNAPIKYGYHLVEWTPAYTKLEYIESTGTQYIDTGIKLSNDIEFWARVSTGVPNVEGIKAGATGLIVWQIQNYFNFRYKTFDSPNATYTLSTNLHYNLNTFYNIGFNINKDSFAVDNQSINKTEKIATTNENIYTGLRDRTASLKIWDNEILVRDFIPVLAPDGTIGMYDTVTNTFFENAGTGTFIAGPEAGNL